MGPVPPRFSTGKQMILRLAFLVLFGFAAQAAWAHAGLTSAGVDPNANNPQPDEPTIAQVAPVDASNAAANGVNSAAAGVNPGTAGVAGAPAGVAGNAAATAPVVSSRAVAPPPPPDPATLPVSVIRPLGKPSGATDEAETGGVSSMHAANPGQARPHAPTQAVPKPPVAVPAPPPARTLPLPATPRVDGTTRALGEKPERPEPEAVADTASSSFIFYSGSGLAGAILLLSVGAFMRARRLDVTRA
jgi:hypothetical protein